MTQIFSDGFESGDFSAWTGTLGSPTVQNSMKHHGTYAAYCSARAQGCYRMFAEVTDAYARFYVYITQWGATVHGLGRLFRNGWDSCCQATVELTNHCWRLIVNQPSETITSNVAASLNTWYCVQLRWTKGVAGGAEMWVWDDSGNELVHLVCTVTTSNYPCTRFDVYNTDSGYGTPRAYYDCAVIADAYVGPEVGAVLKEVSDSFGVVDSVFGDKAFSVVDSALLADVSLKDWSLQVSDTCVLSEAVLRSKLLSVFDSLGVGDVVGLGKVLLLSDLVLLSDVVFASKVLAVSDGVVLVEIVEKGGAGVVRTRVFLLLGDLAVQLTG